MFCVSRVIPDQSLPSELFSAEQMRLYGKVLAESHRLSESRTFKDKLLSRLVENEAVLDEVRRLFTRATMEKKGVLPAADWLLDNFYLIEEHIRSSKRDLPKGYSRALPRLTNGVSAGFPRVWDIALERVLHGDGLVDAETLLGFLETYQSVSTLTLGELWAFPIVLRLALIENLSRAASLVAAEMRAQNEADSWAERMMKVVESDPKNLILVVADMARSDPPLVSAFVAELARKLQGRGSALALPLTWIEQRLSETGLTIDQLVQTALRRQAAAQVSISNSIGSLRSLGMTDWKDFVENSSLVEKTLRGDPSGWYARMDFITRDRYRHAVEDCARSSGRTENEVAERAVSRAFEHPSQHVGYFLIGKGLKDFQRSFRRPLSALRPDRREHCRGALYLLSIVLLSVLVVWWFVATARDGGASGWSLLLVALAAVSGAAGFAIDVVNWAALRLISPRPLPRLDYSLGVPDESRTLVVVPAMLPSMDHLERLIEALEVRCLANRDENILFGLLTDFPDASERVIPQDQALISEARRRIEALNTRYPGLRGGPFFLFHRGRTWNVKEEIWMGRERKRGKLSDLNALLRGASGGFELVVGEQGLLPSIKYVLTLDTDTQLPRDCARQLAATMAHPLNRARLDQGRVVEGYGILQPRLSPTLPAANRSLYSQLNSLEPGIDPYTRSVSDVYQDLFQEGSFVGKGIYDVDVFEAALKDRVPDNAILSHDLLEGCYARSGLASEVQLFEDFPSGYLTDTDRRHRWIRGDWQLLPWLTRPLTALSKGKILDNLRRSLAPLFLLILLSLGWAVSSDSVVWTLVVAGLVFAPGLLADIVAIFQKSKDTWLLQHVASASRSLILHLGQSLIRLALLPFEAWYSLDAIVRTLWRVFVSHRRLLEWRPSETATQRGGLVTYLGRMSVAPMAALAGVVLMAWLQPATLGAALVWFVLWALSPLSAWWLSRPLVKAETRLSSDQHRFLRHLSRKTWAFFETFVTEDEHWLPPDNIQELPETRIAHRTSPTNIGLALLANLTAWDLGYIGSGALIVRTRQTLSSLAKLERYRGHFLNWYDTRTLEPLLPRYVSTVDSGNLAAHLLTLGAGLNDVAEANVLSDRVWDGLADTADALAAIRTRGTPHVLEMFGRELAARGAKSTLVDDRSLLVRLRDLAQGVVEEAEQDASPQGAQWAQALSAQCLDALAELEFLVPWLTEPMSLKQQRFLAEQPHPSLKALAAFSPSAVERLEALRLLGEELGLYSWMDFGFLYDTRCHLLSIGYQVEDHRVDPSFYDLLASEARLASFVAIAQGQIPQEHWFSLGRLLTQSGRKAVLLSWSGSMFEYLMPLLVVPGIENSLLDQTCRAAVALQIEYGKFRGVPWGISESGYNSYDASLSYQYRAFGVPGLGFKRGLVDDLVVSPYASALALLVSPLQACQNLQRLADSGLEGGYGLYEAIDYTPSRLAPGQTGAVVQSFMAHHQGMSLVALASQLCGEPMPRRFESLALVKATAILLEERIPKVSAVRVDDTEVPEFRALAKLRQTAIRVFHTPDTPTPEVHLLSNGRYHVWLSNAGGGSSRWKELAVTRWREDGTRDNWGTFLYLRERESKAMWSNAYQPTLADSDFYEVVFSEGRAEFRRRDGDIETYTEIIVSPEDDIELRRVRVTNRSKSQRTIEITSYAEVILAPGESDAVHPGFSNLFVQTEILDELQTIFATRRPRSSEAATPCLLHLMTVRQGGAGEVSFETDRARFLGRGRTAASPRAMDEGARLSNTQGAVLDPICAIRQSVTLEADATTVIDMVTGVGENRLDALRLAEKYQSKRFADRAFELSGTHSRAVLQQINGTEADALVFGRIAGSILYAQPGLRADSKSLIANRRNQSGLWGYSISGDLPIVLLTIEDSANIALVRQLVQAHSYWRQKGLAVDLVIWNEDHGGYRQYLQEQILALITAGEAASFVDRPGGIFIRSADQISQEDRTLIQAASRVLLSDRNGSLEDQVSGRSVSRTPVPRLTPRSSTPRPSVVAVPPDALAFFNGLGGFSPDGQEYVITTNPETTPAPWSNVIANHQFGTVVSEAGMAYTWSENAHNFRLSPWNDDPVTDESGEAMYLRDEETGQFWSPTPLPRAGEGVYRSRHGFGYSVFEHTEQGIASELWIFVADDAPVKFSRLKVRNDSGRPRRLSATAYVELVLGELRSRSAMHVVTEIDSVTGALFARNRFSIEFGGCVVFADAVGDGRSFTCDRVEFLGRNGTLADPDAMSGSRLSGRSGPALDPCAVFQVPFDLEDGEEREIVFRLGAAQSLDEAQHLVRRFRLPGATADVLDAVTGQWKHTLSAVHVETPDPALDMLANGWLVYQVLSSRLWGRTGYYQSGGAYGFRDQLQDSVALLHTEPGLVRKHLLLAAAHQFTQGDVLHWWHPPGGRGTRTHCSDDYLWLALVTAQYVDSTGDEGVLDEAVPYLEGRPVNANEESYYDLPARSDRSSTLYDHCVQAIARSSPRGQHGLPLMGSGDWNDGMNKVGEKGQGESVWLGFFLYDVLTQFAALADRRRDPAFADQCRTQALDLQNHLETGGWDGEWYRRAYFDDGSPLGSSSNIECQIDSIAQSWSVLSGAASAERSLQAMNSLDRRLVRRGSGLIQLLDPPFNASSMNPGYIQGYVPGVRENGGQYTHAAVWAAMAFARLGDGQRAWELFSLINPINHSRSSDAVATYKVEPYVMAADVYSVAPHTGRGGWTWYTGSAGWMYRLIVESLLGLHRENDKLSVLPCVPNGWNEYKVHYRYGESVYHIVVNRDPGPNILHLVDDASEHDVFLSMPS